jgi:hypothetical protein
MTPPIEIGTSSPLTLSTWNAVNAPLAWRRGRWNETHGFMGSMREFLFGEFSPRPSIGGEGDITAARQHRPTTRCVGVSKLESYTTICR